MPYLVQTGKGKGKYSTRYSLKDEITARIWYSGINTHSGYKKRMIGPDGTVIHRFISSR